MSQHRASIGLLVATALGVSAVAYAQLGGPTGVRIPYQGRLEVDGQPANGTYDFDFKIFNVASGGAACDVFEDSILVSAGSFSTVLGPVDENCVRGQDIFVEIAVSGDRTAVAPEVVGNRKQLFAAAAATTSGAGDFDVDGDLVVAGNMNAAQVRTPIVDASNLVTAPTVDANTVQADSVVAGALTLAGIDLRNTLEVQLLASNVPASNGANFGSQTFRAGSSGLGMLLLSASAFRLGSSGTLTLEVVLDGAVVHSILGYTNESSSHKALPTAFVPVVGAPNALHTIVVREAAGSSVDANDRLQVAYIDYM